MRIEKISSVAGSAGLLNILPWELFFDLVNNNNGDCKRVKYKALPV